LNIKDLSKLALQTKPFIPLASRSVITRYKNIPSSPGFRNENPVLPRPFCDAKINCEYHGRGNVQEPCAPTPRNPSGPKNRPLTRGVSAKSQVCGCVGFSRPNAAKNCPPFNCRLNGKLVVCMNASSTSTEVSLSLSNLKTMFANPSKYGSTAPSNASSMLRALNPRCCGS